MVELAGFVVVADTDGTGCVTATVVALIYSLVVDAGSTIDWVTMGGIDVVLKEVDVAEVSASVDETGVSTVVVCEETTS